jgi:predicted nucleic acid-binding protein
VGQALVEFLLDSVILIDHLDDIPEATAYLEGSEGKTAISVVTRAEVLTGYDVDSREEAEFLDEFPLLEITKPVADLAARLRREHGWKLPDAFQAALAKHHDLELVTRNTRDFSPERYDLIVVPYSLETRG